MRVQAANLTFTSLVKTLYKRGRIDIKYGIYGEELKRKTVSDEHIKCKCFGGTKDLSNIALADARLNNLRGCQPIELFTTMENVRQYCNQFLNIKVQGFNGRVYAQGILKTFLEIFNKGNHNEENKKYRAFQ